MSRGSKQTGWRKCSRAGGETGNSSGDPVVVESYRIASPQVGCFVKGVSAGGSTDRGEKELVWNQLLRESNFNLVTAPCASPEKWGLSW